MAKKISDLDEVASVALSDLFEIERGGESYKATPQQLIDLLDDANNTAEGVAVADVGGYFGEDPTVESALQVLAERPIPTDSDLRPDLADGETAGKGAALIAVSRDGTVRTLAGKLEDFPVTVADKGAVNDGSATATANTVALQAAIDFVHGLGGGTVVVPRGDWLFGASSLSETYSNAGASVLASSCGLVLRSGVDLIGHGRGSTKLHTLDRTIFAIAAIAPDGNTLEGFELAGDWDQGDSGAGHGIITLATEGGADLTCRKVTIRDVYVHNFGSYGIGFQCGFPMDCTIENVIVEYTGADGIDLKARTDATTGIQPAGNSVKNVRVRHFGLRVEGSAGVDCRGIWQMDDVTVTDFGGNASLYYVGVRFRTKEDPATNKWPTAGARSTLTNFYIRPSQPLVGTGFTGIMSGSDDVHVSNGNVVACTNGVDLTGNAFGSATRNKISNVNAIECTQYGFITRAGTASNAFTACDSTGAGTAGFRNEGTNTRFAVCGADEATKLSSSVDAATTEKQAGCHF